jgi:hypothetical protein
MTIVEGVGLFTQVKCNDRAEGKAVIGAIRHIGKRHGRSRPNIRVTLENAAERGTLTGSNRFGSRLARPG